MSRSIPTNTVLLCESSISSTSQNFPEFYGNKINYHIHTQALFVPVLMQINLAHGHHPVCWRSNLNIIFASTPRFSKSSLSLRLPHHKRIYNFLLPLACLMHRPSHSSRFCHLKNIWRGVQFIEAPYYGVFFSPLLPRPSRAQMSSSAPYIHIPSTHVPPSVSHPYKTKRKVSLYVS